MKPSQTTTHQQDRKTISRHLTSALRPSFPAAIYIRTALRENHNDCSSLSRQRRACEQFAASRKWRVTHIYEDNGYPGNNDQRPGLQHMLTDAQKGEFKVLLVYNLDRLSRSVADLLNMLASLEAHGITVIPVAAPFQPLFQRLLLNILTAWPGTLKATRQEDK